MSLNAEGVPRRRRGRALEQALLGSAWTELSDRGYDKFTFDGVAARAGTSRAVLYRRWPGKQELVHAALMYAVGKDRVVPPDTGNLRSDVIAILRQANTVRVRTATLLLTHLGDFYRETDTTLAGLSAFVEGGRAALDQAIQRAISRGEIRPGQIAPRVARLPVDLFRHEVLMTLQPVPDDVIEEIVDTIFLPLAHSSEPR